MGENYINKYTSDTLIKLENIIIEEKNLLLTGGSAVGKTFLAQKLAKKLTKFKDENIYKISLHEGYNYDDFVSGTEPKVTKDDKLVFERKNKILLKAIKIAKEKIKSSENIVIILDDINRCDIYSVFGDMINFIDRRNKEIPDNLYIIATMNTAIKTSFATDYEFLRKFMIYNLKSDYKFIESDIYENLQSDSEIKKMYDEVNKVIINSIDNRYKNEEDKYLIGHGFFAEKDISKVYYSIKYNIVPILEAYYNDGIIMNKDNIKNLYKKYNNSITLNYNDIKYIDYKIEYKPLEENLASKIYDEEAKLPVDNLIKKILDLKLISNIEIFNEILVNKNILEVIGKSKYDDNTKTIGYLIHKKSDINNIRRYTKSNPKGENYYSSENIHIYNINKEEYALFTRYTGLSDAPTKNEGATTVQYVNNILYKIIYNFYDIYLKNIDEYNKYNNNELIDLYKYVKNELEYFVSNINKLENNPRREKWYKEVQKQILKLTIINMKYEKNIINNQGNECTINGNEIYYRDGNEDKKITIQGVYRMNDDKYIKLMDDLNVKQIILQGPPGTSKTYTAKQMIQENHNITSANLDEYKIKNYEEKNFDEEFKDKDFGWDIVQFHPSYGYEDFIRGISVGDNGKEVIYKTVNKVLGNIASLAKKYEDTKKFYLIIDEINRANVATVFGELIYALEYRGETIATPYKIDDDNNISIPNNLYIIGTMNTADKSVGGIDYAIRRRFLFVPLLPSEKIIEDAYKKQNDEEFGKKAINLFKNITSYFNRYKADDYHLDDIQIGHTYFLIDKDDKQRILEQRFEYQILPILKEYYKDGVFKHSKYEDDIIGKLNALVTNDYEILSQIEMSDGQDIISCIFNELIKEANNE